MESERQLPVEAKIGQINCQRAAPKWAGGQEIGVEVKKVGEQYEVGGVYTGETPTNWLDIVPTRQTFETAEGAISYAEKLLAEIERWPNFDAAELAGEESIEGQMLKKGNE